jgi:hypothetical protein
MAAHTPKEGIMLQRWHRSLAFCAILLQFIPTVTVASMDEAGLSFASAKDEMSQMLDAAGQEKARLFAEHTEQFKKNMDVVQYQIEQLGKNLHEKERKWISETTKEKALATYMKVVGAIAQVKQALADAKSPSSEASTLKGYWSEFSDAFDKLWDDYLKRGKQLAEAQKEVDERVKLFKEDCKKCF